MELTQDLLKSFFTYNDGFLYWKISPRYKINIGYLAGYIQKTHSGLRRKIKIKGKFYQSSRLIFLWHHGWLPNIVDHEDRNQLNDRIENLRAATISQNNKNKTSARGSSSIYLGVTWNTKNNNWRASIKSDGKQMCCGSFLCETEAALAYNRQAVFYHGEFANLNIIKPSIAA